MPVIAVFVVLAVLLLVVRVRRGRGRAAMVAGAAHSVARNMDVDVDEKVDVAVALAEIYRSERKEKETMPRDVEHTLAEIYMYGGRVKKPSESDAMEATLTTSILAEIFATEAKPSLVEDDAETEASGTITPADGAMASWSDFWRVAQVV